MSPLRPPSPRVTGELLASASRCLFKPVVAARLGDPELGVFVDPELGREVHLVLALADVDVAEGRVAWAIATSSGSAGRCLPFLFTRETFHVLHEGEIVAALYVQWDGRHYRLEAGWDGYRPVAAAVFAGDATT